MTDRFPQIYWKFRIVYVNLWLPQMIISPDIIQAWIRKSRSVRNTLRALTLYTGPQFIIRNFDSFTAT